MSVYDAVKKSFLIKWLFRLFRIEVVGEQNQPEKAGYIVCANHSSYYDPIIMGAALRHNIRYMAKAELFKVPVLRSVVRAFGAFPVERGGSDLASIKNTIRLIDGGENVGIYPQGHRRRYVHPATTQIKSGASMMAYRAKCGILPVTIYTDAKKVKLFKRTRVIIHPFMPYDELGIDSGSHESFRKASERVFAAICEPFGEVGTE